MTAARALHEALADLAEAGQAPPCYTHPNRAWWTSNKRAEREQAAELCAPCPIIDACGVAGRAEEFNVWGGRDRTPAPPAKRTPATPRPARPRAPRPSPTLDPIECPACSVMFTPTQATARVCSPKCRSRMKRARHNTTTGATS